MFFSDDKIKFLCNPELIDIIPHPYPARKYIPDWYKKLGMYSEDEEGMELPTLKRCPPFLDAMSTGWIIPLAADVTFKVVDDGAGVNWKTDFAPGLIDHHNMKQISTHPNVPSVPIKVLNHWIIQTPPGWSCLFTPALNRPDDVFDLMSGVVETDKFWEHVNFPGFLKIREGTFTARQGYPLMQVIPYKRGFKKEAVVRAMNDKELKKVQLHRDRHAANFSQYRNNMWEKK